MRKVIRLLLNPLSVALFSSTLMFCLTAVYRNDIVNAVESLKRADRSAEEQKVIDVYKKVNKAVVFLTTITLTSDPFDFVLTPEPQKGTGSGIIIDASHGIILTNLHVVGDAHRIEITLADGHNYQARLVGFDKQTDIAVLMMEKAPDNLVAVEFGDSSDLEVGQRVLAIGSPFGLSRTLTQGIVSSLDRTVKNPNDIFMKGLIQTDAAINPGNSGGPLLDTDGRLVGINTAILSRSGEWAGIGFAASVNQIRRILPQILATGRVQRPRMGWILIDTASGPMVLRVLEGSAAEKAKIEPLERKVNDVFLRGFKRDFSSADLIVKVNGRPVSSKKEVEQIIESNSPPWNPVTLLLRTGGKEGPEREVTVNPEIGKVNNENQTP